MGNSKEEKSNGKSYGKLTSCEGFNIKKGTREIMPGNKETKIVY
jgi:hypothetical protein